MSADSVGTWLGVVISLVGFGLAFWQLRKTKSAVESARDAVVVTEARVGTNLLLSALPRLLELEIELTSALSAGRTADAAGILIRWRHVASQCEALLRRDPRAVSSTADVLDAAVSIIADAGAAVGEAAVRGETLAIADTRAIIAVATSLVSGEIARLQGYSGDYEHR